MSKGHFVLFLLLIVPILPLMLVQSALAAQITIAWDAQSGATGYNVCYGMTSEGYGSPMNVGNVTSYALTGLSAGQRYFIAVTAYNQYGGGGYSNELNAVGLATSVNPVGAGTVNPSGVTWYNSGQSVSISATVNSGYTFSGWSGDVSGPSSPSSVVMNWPKNVTANFSIQTGLPPQKKPSQHPELQGAPIKGLLGILIHILRVGLFQTQGSR